MNIALASGTLQRLVSFHSFRARREQRTLAKQKKILGATPRRWLEYLVAILLGNAIYYKSLWRHLPESLQHQGFQTDMGSLVDLLVCVAVYGLIRLGSSLYRRPKSE